MIEMKRYEIVFFGLIMIVCFGLVGWFFFAWIDVIDEDIRIKEACEDQIGNVFEFVEYVDSGKYNCCFNKVMLEEDVYVKNKFCIGLMEE